MKASSLIWHLTKIMAQGGDFEIALHDPHSDDSFSLEDRATQTPPAFDFDEDEGVLYLSIKPESLPPNSPFQVVGAAVYDAVADELQCGRVLTVAHRGRYVACDRPAGHEGPCGWRKYTQPPGVNHPAMGPKP